MVVGGRTVCVRIATVSAVGQPVEAVAAIEGEAVVTDSDGDEAVGHSGAGAVDLDWRGRLAVLEGGPAEAGNIGAHDEFPGRLSAGNSYAHWHIRPGSGSGVEVALGLFDFPGG